MNSLISKLAFRNRYLQNSAWQIAEKLAKILSNLVIGVLVIRYLGPEQFGLLAAAMAVVYLAQPIATLGLNAILEREIINDEKQVAAIISSALMARLTAGLVLACLLMVAVAIFSDRSLQLLVLLCIGPVLFNSHSIFQNYFNAYTQSKTIVKARVVVLTLIDVAKITFIVTEQSVYFFAALVSAEVALYLIAGLIAFSRHQSESWGVKAARFTMIRSLVASSWPLILSGFAYMVYLRVDVLMLQSMIDPEASGLYASATKISEAWFFIGVAISSSLFPAVLKAKQIGQEAFERQMRLMVSILFIVSVSVAGVVCFLASPIIQLLYGEPFKAAASILQLHIFGGVLVFLGFAVSKWLISEDQIIFSLVRHLIGAALNVALNLYLIPIFGGVGAAVATLSAYLAANYLFAFLFPPTRRLGVLLTRGMLSNHFRTLVTLYEKNR